MRHPLAHWAVRSGESNAPRTSAVVKSTGKFFFATSSQDINELNEFTSGAPAREERKLIRLKNRVSLKEGKDATGQHFGPDLSQDLEEANGTKVSHHGGAVSLILDENQQDPLPLVMSGGFQPEFLEVLKDLLLDQKRGNLEWYDTPDSPGAEEHTETPRAYRNSANENGVLREMVRSASRARAA
jgi:hypothetical protein